MHGVKIWSRWLKRPPISFHEAHDALTANGALMYSKDRLSQLWLYGDLLRLGIIVPPSGDEMAELVFQANSGALRGLKILGFERSEEEIREAMRFLRDTLNIHLPKKVKALFSGGDIDLFDVEHALCKISRKQSQK